MPKVKIPTPFRHYTGGYPEVEVGGATAGETLGNLTQEYPDLRQHLYTSDGKCPNETWITLLAAIAPASPRGWSSRSWFRYWCSAVPTRG